MAAYYNEIDPYDAQWLRNLIKAGHIADGVVDERSIEDVTPDDIKEFTQCHFFAGVGVWSLSLRRAGWPDDKPIWSASCPCQPFSSAGDGLGFADKRHLWPHFAWIVSQRKPPIIVGEQVASKAAGAWIDLVQANLENMGYAFGAVAFPAAGVGAPHIRDRAYWVGNANNQRPQKRVRKAGVSSQSSKPVKGQALERAGIHAVRLADSDSHGFSKGRQRESSARGNGIERNGVAGGLADAMCARPQEQQRGPLQSKSPCQSRSTEGGGLSVPGPVNGFWRDADWIGCRDGSFRPVEAGTFPLANGSRSRVGRLFAYGNAICAPQATAFILSVMEVT